MKQEPTSPGRRALRAAAGAATAAGKAATAALDAEESTGRATGRPIGPETESEVEISEALAQMPEGASYSVWKFEEPHGEKAWCTDGPVAEFDPAAIGAAHGGGRYIVYFRKPDDRGRKVPAGAKRFQVAKSVKIAQPVPVAAPAGTGGMADVQKLFATIAEMATQQARQTVDAATMLQGLQAAVLKTALESRAPVVDPIAQFSAMMAAMAPLIRRENSGELGPDFWFKLMDRDRRDADPAAQLGKMMELVAQAREMYGDGDGAPPWVGMVEKGLGLVQSMMDRAPRAIGPGAPPPGSKPTDPASPAPREDTVPAAAQPSDPFLQAIAPYVPTLIQHAERGHEPDTYAGVILDSVEVGYYPQLADWLQQPNIGKILEETWPDVGRFPQWFGELVACMQERLAPEEAEPEAKT